MTLSSQSPMFPRVLVYRHVPLISLSWQFIIWNWRLSCLINPWRCNTVSRLHTVAPSDNLGIVNRLSFSALTRLCRFLLYITQIWIALSKDGIQMRVQSTNLRTRGQSIKCFECKCVAFSWKTTACAWERISLSRRILSHNWIHREYTRWQNQKW